MHRILNKKVIVAIPCLLRGGTEMQTLLLVRALVELDYDVEVCCYFEFDKLVVGEFKAAGASVQLLDWPRSMGSISFILSLARIFREKSPDVVHVQYLAPGLLPIVASRIARVPVVIATVHYPGTPHGIAAHGLLRLGAMLTDRFTCVSEATEKSWFGNSSLLLPNQLESIAGRRHFTLPNAVDIEGLDKALAAESPEVKETASQLKNKMIVGTVSRLNDEKGIDILLNAFALLKKSIPSAHLLIVGDGSQKADLQGLARQLGIGDAISWLGSRTWEAAMEYMGLMDVVVVPSRFEGFGLTAVEAMACRKPVVASKVDGLAEVIKNGVNGYLIPAEDITALANALFDLLRDKNHMQAIGMAARQHVAEYYAYSQFRKRCLVLYKPFVGCDADLQ